MYVITNGTEYITKNFQGKYVTIRNAAMAEEFTKTNANAILHNQVPKKLRNGMYLEKVDDGKKRELPETSTHSKESEFRVPDNIKQWIEKLQSLNGLAQEASVRERELNVKLSNIDKENVDLTHYLEFQNLNACQGYKVAKMLQDNLRKRREVKNELTFIQFILNKKITDSVSEEAIRMTENITKKQYEPRILKELFDI